LLPPGATLYSAPDQLPEGVTQIIRERGEGLRGAAAFKFLWQDFLYPLALAMAPGVDAAVDAFEPDVVVADQQAVAGAIVSRRRGLRWATSATTSAELTRPFDALPKIAEWVEDLLVDLQIELGIGEADARLGDVRFSDQLVIAFTTRALLGPLEQLPDRCVLVGPAIAARTETTAFPWGWLDPRSQHVLVSLGTVNQAAGGRFFAAAIEAVMDLGLQAVVVAPPDLVGAVPDRVLVRPYVPQLALLTHCDAVVSHAGHNTTCEALAHGVPLVMAPIRDDQPIVADQVVAAGAGLRVKFGRVSAGQLGVAIGRVLGEPRFRAAATALADSFVAAGGAARAADHLEALAS
jgi:MGT family glycosyltransferase